MSNEARYRGVTAAEAPDPRVRSCSSRLQCGRLTGALRPPIMRFPHWLRSWRTLLRVDQVAQSATARHGTAAEVAAAFLKLGLTSFGGPVAHLGYFRREFVE